MNWHTTLRTIYQKLDTTGFPDTSIEIRHEQLAGGTGGEIFTRVVSKLIAIKNHQPEIYSTIKDETEAMIAYGKSIKHL
jgi:hypothetical protein